VTAPFSSLPNVDFLATGAPKAWPRPVTARGGHVYRNGSADEWGHNVRAFCVQCLQGLQGWPRDGSFHVVLQFTFKRPPVHFLRGALRETAPVSYLKRPDVDNLAKQVLDALGSWDDLPPLLWWDDAQVEWLQVSKRWGNIEGMRFRAWWTAR
jgi:Holliday junction resolvase RusA-like endonuclease